jgi:hypothetical protein
MMMIECPPGQNLGLPSVGEAAVHNEGVSRRWIGDVYGCVL